MRFDAAHAADPDRETVDGREQPKEFVYAKRMSAMLARYAPEAPEIVRLAARCQHIERWKIPRGEYAMDRIGYLQWRKRLNKFHAKVAGNILREVGDDEATIGRVAMLTCRDAAQEGGAENRRRGADAGRPRRPCVPGELSRWLCRDARPVRHREVQRHPGEDGKEDVGVRARGDVDA